MSCRNVQLVAVVLQGCCKLIAVDLLLILATCHGNDRLFPGSTNTNCHWQRVSDRTTNAAMISHRLSYLKGYKPYQKALRAFVYSNKNDRPSWPNTVHVAYIFVTQQDVFATVFLP